MWWVFTVVCRLSLVAVSRGYSSCGVWASHCSGFSCCGAWAVGSAGFSACSLSIAACRPYSVSSVVVAHGLSYSITCEIFPDQGSNRCPLHWGVGS